MTTAEPFNKPKLVTLDCAVVAPNAAAGWVRITGAEVAMHPLASVAVAV
jgi:hypothetical protein